MRPQALLMGLPDELVEWVDQNKELVRRVQLALSDSYASLTEDQIWEVVASSCSPEWQKAREDLRTAEKSWNEFNDPLNAPLGAIGQALDSDETESTREHFAFSLSHFTIINEGLRQRPDLSTLLNVLLVQKRMLDQSAVKTQRVKAATNALSEMVDPLRDDFMRAARPPSRIQKQFKTSMRRLLASKKPIPSMNVIVPWLPGI